MSSRRFFMSSAPMARSGLRVTIAAALAALAALMLGLPAAAAPATPGVIPPNATPGDQTYGAWSARWWQYVLAQPVPTNPLLDATGQHCATNQSGPVFFLVGTFGSGSATRNQCVVPAGKLLFFPLLNFADVHAPGDGLDTPELVWKDLQGLISPTTSLFASVDGAPVSNLDPRTTPYHACAGPASLAPCGAPAFTVTLPADNVFGAPAGQYFPSVDDGFYLMLAPLSAGKHTLRFGGTAASGASQDITYSLTVK
jgi:hypothetical protein